MGARANFKRAVPSSGTGRGRGHYGCQHALHLLPGTRSAHAGVHVTTGMRPGQAGNREKPDRQTGSDPSVTDRDLDGVHVLVVEDTDDSREVFRAVLEYCGALVTTAASAEEAKRILDRIRPHVLVSDIAMPDDGVELIREVKAVAQSKGMHIPAIAITAYRGRREDLLAEGFVELLEKPFDPNTLCKAIRRHAQLET